MEFKLVEQEEMTFTGFTRDFSSVYGKDYQEIPEFWGELFHSGDHELLVDDQDELGTVGISYEWSEAEKSFKYMVGVRSDEDIPGTETVTFEPKTYAVFTVEGACPQSVQDAVDYIHDEFLPDGKYRHAGGPEIEVYPDGDARDDDYVCYYWVPVVEK